MKKRLLAVVALAMAASLAFGLTACGGSIKGEELPSENFEEAWAAAFDEANFENIKLTCKGTAKFSMGGTPQCNGTMSLTFTSVRANGLEHGTARMRQTVMGQTYTITSEYYYNGEKYYVKEDNEDWHIDEDYSFVGGGFPLEQFFGMDFQGCRESDKFVYDAKESGYVWLSGKQDEQNFEEIIIKFKTGKIAAIIQKSAASGQESDSEMKTEYTITYGGQSVTLPEAFPAAE